LFFFFFFFFFFFYAFPSRLEIYGPKKPDYVDGNAGDASRVIHNYIPDREEGEVAEKPLDEFPVPTGVGDDWGAGSQKKFTVVGPKPRVAKVLNGVAAGSGSFFLFRLFVFFHLF
jgi:hypothetical protein